MDGPASSMHLAVDSERRPLEDVAQVSELVFVLLLVEFAVSSSKGGV